MNDAASAGTAAGPLRALSEELVRSGVRDVVVCPGSRSTPLALALRVNPALHVWLHLDERAASFFALGAAKASRRPVAILSTSGTAAANFMPALVEARQGRVPLLALTADRPPELRDRDAAQTIDQDHLYGRYAKWYAELPVPTDDARLEAHVRGVIGRAVAVAAAAPAGPVHLDLPFREPLLPDGPVAPGAAGPTDTEPDTPFATVLTGARAVTDRDLESLSARAAGAGRGLIVCGPLDVAGFEVALASLAAATGFPILADALANVRFGHHDRAHVVSRYDALLRSSAFRAEHAPDLVLRFGGAPTSRALIEALLQWAAPQIVVDDGGWSEPTLLPVTMVDAEPIGFANGIRERLLGRTRFDAAWSDSWRHADTVAEDATTDWLTDQQESFEGAVPPALSANMPDGGLLFAGNSMPVRDLDAFLGSGNVAIRCLGNRGANGIDGLVSTALGAAAVHDGPVVAVIGDVSFIHDLNALASVGRQGISATIVLVDNDGGGIFSFLPQAAADRPELGLPEHYEELFGTPHGLDFAALVPALGAEHRLVDAETLGDAVAASIEAAGVQVLEFRSERAANARLHRDVNLTVAAAIEAASALRGAAR